MREGIQWKNIEFIDNTGCLTLFSKRQEYVREGIQWKNIEFIDNTGCLTLFSKRPVIDCRRST